MPIANAHGTGIYYEVHGEGPAVLFCHGAGSNAATWWQQVPEFSRHFTCIVYDHRCFVRAAAPQAAFRPEHFVGDALAVLDAAGCERAALVCQSLGGVTGLRLALAHPGRVSAFVSCDSPLAIDHPQMNANILHFLASVPASEIENRALSAAFIDRNRELAFLYAQVNQFNPMAYATEGLEEWKRRLNGLFEGDHLVKTQALAHIACPTLFVLGAQDRAVTPDVVRELAGMVPRSEVLQIEGAGHSPYFEQPAVFNRHVLGFLARALNHR